MCVAYYCYYCYCKFICVNIAMHIALLMVTFTLVRVSSDCLMFINLMHVSIYMCIFHMHMFFYENLVLFGNTPFNASVFEAAKSLLAKRQLVHEKLIADYLKTGKVHLLCAILCVCVVLL
jgi:hypothetical protein